MRGAPVEKVIVWTVRRYVGGHEGTWVWFSLALTSLRVVRTMARPREVVGIAEIERGQTLIVDQRRITNRKQARQFKAEKKAAKRERRAVKKQARLVRQERRQVARAERRAARTATREARATDSGFTERFRRRSADQAGRLEA
jgi:hypothetical protein